MNTEPQKTNLKKESTSFKMPKSICIGDPLYFKDKKGLDLTYERDYKGLSRWKCEIQMIEDKLVYPPDEYSSEPFETEDIYFKAYMACDDNMLSIIKDNMHYSNQTLTQTEIGVDSASYLLYVDDRGDTVKTGGEGFWGHVIEYKRDSKLEAVSIELGLPDYLGNDFEDHKRFIEYVFNCKF